MVDVVGASASAVRLLADAVGVSASGACALVFGVVGSAAGARVLADVVGGSVDVAEAAGDGVGALAADAVLVRRNGFEGITSGVCSAIHSCFSILLKTYDYKNH